VYKSVVFITVQAKAGRSQVSAKNANLRLQVLKKSLEIQVQLQGLPQPQLRFLRVTRTHQHVQGGTVLLQQIGGYMCADVSG
jgi:hypothetical protein